MMNLLNRLNCIECCYFIPKKPYRCNHIDSEIKHVIPQREYKCEFRQQLESPNLLIQQYEKYESEEE